MWCSPSPGPDSSRRSSTQKAGSAACTTGWCVPCPCCCTWPFSNAKAICSQEQSSLHGVSPPGRCFISIPDARAGTSRMFSTTEPRPCTEITGGRTRFGLESVSVVLGPTVFFSGGAGPGRLTRHGCPSRISGPSPLLLSFSGGGWGHCSRYPAV